MAQVIYHFDCSRCKYAEQTTDYKGFICKIDGKCREHGTDCSVELNTKNALFLLRDYQQYRRGLGVYKYGFKIGSTQMPPPFVVGKVIDYVIHTFRTLKKTENELHGN